jgi:DNA-binding GntR family transcriptional regulator
MSCIRFNTPAQRAQLKAMAPAMLTSEQAAALHPAPEVTESKLRRIRLLARDANPKIRESAASGYHTPDDVFEALARDDDESVRACVARNENAPCDVLRFLADDPSERVRGFLAVNFFVPSDAMDKLSRDESRTVRELARWKAELAVG